jgi:hypothetical protein
MLHDLTLGHLDINALRECRAVAMRPLDMGVIAQLLGELGGVDYEGRPTLRGGRVEVGNGYVIVPWLMPYPVPESVDERNGMNSVLRTSAAELVEPFCKRLPNVSAANPHKSKKVYATGFGVPQIISTGGKSRGPIREQAAGNAITRCICQS